MANLLANLNERQLAAVTLPPTQHALILAGAGSGKTRVLTTRIAWLIQTGQVSPAGVLAVTFTNKAAREMMTRLSAMLPINPRGMWIGTFHGLCNRFLRAHHRDAGLPATFQILDSADQLAALKRLMKTLNVDDERYPPRQVQHFINDCKEEGLRAPQVPAHDDFNRRFIEIYAAYDAQCQREGVVDFAELLLRSFELLSRNEVLREHYRGRFRHVLVDEFQDTNRLQYQWLKLLAGPTTAVFAVGDDDQSIYSFRGARVGNMADFEREFAVENLIKLEQNYRSHGHILDCANELIRKNPRRLGKNLWTDAGAGELVRVMEAGSDGEEAHWLVEQIQALSAEGGARSDMAVLYRSNAQSRVIEHALFSAGIAYRVYGGLRFFERAEVKHALSYLRLIENPADDTAFLRVVNFPARGIGARSVEQLADAAGRSAVPLIAAIAQVGGAAAVKLAGFARLIEAFRHETAALTLPEAVEHVIERSGLIAHYQTEREGQERVENLRELVNAAAAFAAESAAPAEAEASAAEPGPAEAPLSVLASFLAHASLEAGEHQAGEGVDAVQLMTVHAAKGLEFDAVFITGLEEGLFPHENAVTEADGLDEERRLMYVAITRARERLYLSFCQTRMLHGQLRYHLRSRFLEELPQGALKWLSPRVYAASRASQPGAWRTEPQGLATTRVFGQARPASRPDGFDRGVGWRIGQGVAHARFGEGVILDIEGSGSDARVRVNFGREGVKWLALSVAKLQAL